MSRFTLGARFDRLTPLHKRVSTLERALIDMHAHAHTLPLSASRTHACTHTHTHICQLDFEALRPSCPSFQTLSRQEKNLGHHLSSLNLSITVTLDQWCRTHPSSPAGPCWTGLAQSSPSYRCQESQLTACCCS